MAHQLGIAIRFVAEHRQDDHLQLVIQRVGVFGPVVVARHAGILVSAYRPAGYAFDASFTPPAVQDAERRDAVNGGLHAAGARGFERGLRRVEPEVYAGGDQLREIDAVVFQVNQLDFALERLHDFVDVADDLLSRRVLRVCLARIDELERADRLRYFDEPRGIPEQQVGTLVDRRAPRETDGENLGLQADAGAPLHLCEKHFLRLAVRCPDKPLGDVERVTQAGVVFAPARDMLVEQPGDGGTGPGGHMHAVGDGVDVVLGEHLLRHMPMALCHSVDVVAVVEREVRHVQHRVGAEFLLAFRKRPLITGDHLMHEVQRKLVLPGRHRRVGRENASGFDQMHHLRRDGVFGLLVGHIPGLSGKLIRKLQGQQRGMSFVHVEALDFVVAPIPAITQGAQHPDPAYAQH